MKRISVANDRVPIGEFKAGISKWIKKSKSSGNPIVITQHGHPAAVVISPGDYDQLSELRQFVYSNNPGFLKFHGDDRLHGRFSFLIPSNIALL